MSEENLCSKEIELLNKAGVVLFISCAITGTVVLDHIVSKQKIRGGLSVFAIYIFPFCIFGYLFLKYLLKYILNEDPDAVGPGWLTSVIALGAMVLYNLFAKALYYQKQTNRPNV